MAEGLDDYEMKDYTGEEFPEYDNYDDEELDIEYNRLDNEMNLINRGKTNRAESLETVMKKMKYIKFKMNEKENEADTSFIDSGDGKTVEITNDDNKVSVPKVVFIKKKNLEVKLAIEKFVIKEYNKDEFIFPDENKSHKAFEILLNTSITNDGNVEFRRKGSKKSRLAKQIVLKRNKEGVLEFNTAKYARYTVEGFKEELDEMFKKQDEKLHNNEDIHNNEEDNNEELNGSELNNSDLHNNGLHNNEEEVELESMLSVESGYTNIKGLSPKENRELEGVLNPTGTMDPKSRIGDDGALQIQADEFQRVINETIEERNNYEGDEDTLNPFDERINGLREARDRTLEQRQIEEAREQQEEDISRLQKFKEWAKENLAGLSALAISIAGIITTIVVAGRTVIMKGAQATSKFAKAVAEIGKKLWPFLAPLLSILSTVLSWGAKGLAWLASNLWVLVIASLWFLYEFFSKKNSDHKK